MIYDLLLLDLSQTLLLVLLSKWFSNGSQTNYRTTLFSMLSMLILLLLLAVFLYQRYKKCASFYSLAGIYFMITLTKHGGIVDANRTRHGVTSRYMRAKPNDVINKDI